MRKLTEADKRRLNRRIGYLCRNQKAELRSFPTGAMQYRNEYGVFFLGCRIRVSRGSGEFQHIGDIILELFREAHRGGKATAELVEVR